MSEETEILILKYLSFAGLRPYLTLVECYRLIRFVVRPCPCRSSIETELLGTFKMCYLNHEVSTRLGCL